MVKANAGIFHKISVLAAESSVPRRFYRAGLEILSALTNDAVSNLEHHFLQEKAQVASRTEVGWRDVPDPIGMGGKLVAFFETRARGIAGIIDGNRLAAISAQRSPIRRAASGCSASGTPRARAAA